MENDFVQTAKKTLSVVVCLVVRWPSFLDRWAATRFVVWDKTLSVRAKKLRTPRMR